ncbi:MAG TPA: DUF1990 domain-containing protein [Vicinamibacterales bacterium]|nr:DUF1990 domain-containing protein [Vicinamibacterales bacterium]
MFFAQRPSRETIDRFVRDSQELPISYGPIGIVNGETPCRDLDEATVTIGHGRTDFQRARTALTAWKQFDIGWVEVVPRHAPVEVGTVVAVLIRHLGFWSLNGCRVLYTVGGDGRFGFAYGTLTNHAESGEELFEVRLDPENDDVTYRIRATSRSQAVLARIGQPIVRRLQARFRHDSASVMKRAMQEFGAQP